MAHQLYVLQCLLFGLLHEKRHTPVEPADQVNLPAVPACLICYSNSITLSVMAVLPGEPGLAGFIAAKDDGSGGDNWSYKT